MNRFLHRFINNINQRDEWLYLALIVVVSLMSLEQNSWWQYGHLLATNTLYLAPVLLFKFSPTRLIKRQSLWQKRLAWLMCIVVYPALLIIYLNHQSAFEQLSWLSSGNIVLLAPLIELLLKINSYLMNKQPLKIALNRIGLDELILFFLITISCYVALLISSDLSLWYQSNSIPKNIDFAEVFKRPLTFISLAIQLFSLFFCGYIFYWLNHHFLIKSVLASRGLFIYLCSVLATVAILSPILIELYLFLPINHMAEPIIPAIDANAFDWANTRVFLAVMLLSLPIILVIQWHQKSNKLALLEKEKIQTELSLLKQQIDPHFFLNTLNNLYALCRKKSDQAPEVVLQLAELMQYVVYRGQEQRVTIDEEVGYIFDYIQLQSIRLKQELTFEHDIQVTEQHLQIAPLLLIILVENAFKHGIEVTPEQSYLSITLSFNNEQLTFTCINSVCEDLSSKPIIEGVGLTNLKRRLALLYPDNFQLSLQPDNKKFTAILTINTNTTNYLRETADD